MPEDSQNKIKAIRNRVFYYIIRSIIWLLRLMPRRLGIFCMRILARVLVVTAGSMRRKTIRHLNMVFEKQKSASEIKTMARQVFIHLCTVLVDILRQPKMSTETINSLVTAEGQECISQAMQNGRGVILLTGHFGNWELVGAWLAHNGTPLHAIGTPLFNPELDRLLVDIRNSSGIINIARGKATREIIRSLKKGEAVGMLIDQDTKVPGVFVNFFDRPTFTPVGAAQLAKKLEVDIIPIFMYLKDDLTYHVECGPPLDLQRTDNEEEDLFNNTQKCSDACERIIKRFPEQWVWMHKRWKTPPERFGKEAIGSKKVFG